MKIDITPGKGITLRTTNYTTYLYFGLLDTNVERIIGAPTSSEADGEYCKETHYVDVGISLSYFDHKLHSISTACGVKGIEVRLNGETVAEKDDALAEQLASVGIVLDKPQEFEGLNQLYLECDNWQTAVLVDKDTHIPDTISIGVRFDKDHNELWP